MQLLSKEYKMHVMTCGCWLRESNLTHETLDCHLCRYHGSKGHVPRITVKAFYTLITKYGRSRAGVCQICSRQFNTAKDLKAHKIDQHAY